MEKKYKNRLLKLADFLETLPRRAFDFGTFAETRKRCGTVACAIGWACMTPLAKRHKIRLIDTARPDRDQDEPIELCPKRGKLYTSFESVARELYDVDKFDFWRLFVPGESHQGQYSGLPATATPKQVAKHIRKWVGEEP